MSNNITYYIVTATRGRVHFLNVFTRTHTSRCEITSLKSHLRCVTPSCMLVVVVVVVIVVVVVVVVFVVVVTLHAIRAYSGVQRLTTTAVTVPAGVPPSSNRRRDVCLKLYSERYTLVKPRMHSTKSRSDPRLYETRRKTYYLTSTYCYSIFVRRISQKSNVNAFNNNIYDSTNEVSKNL